MCFAHILHFIFIDIFLLPLGITIIWYGHLYYILIIGLNPQPLTKFISDISNVYFCQAQFHFQSGRTEYSLNPDYFYPHPRDSSNKVLLDYLGKWNLVWKLYSTKLGQIKTV